MFLGEVVGTAVLILLGDGVVAGVLLNRSKAQNAGWVVITCAWGIAVSRRCVQSLAVSDGVAHLNPAVTIGLAFLEIGPEWSDVPQLIAGQFLGAIDRRDARVARVPAHWAATDDPGLKLAVFSHGPGDPQHGREPDHRDHRHGFMLVFGVLALGPSGASLDPLGSR